MFPAVPYSQYIIGSLPWYSLLVVSGIITAILLHPVQVIIKNDEKENSKSIMYSYLSWRFGHLCCVWHQCHRQGHC